MASLRRPERQNGQYIYRLIALGSPFMTALGVLIRQWIRSYKTEDLIPTHTART